MAALDRVERMGPSLHRLPADELLAIQATLRGGVPAPGGEGFLLPPIAAAATPSATEAAAAPPPPPGLTAAQHATLPCHVCERAPGYHCAICLGDVEAGQRVCTLSCAHAFHEGCVREWLRRAQVCLPAACSRQDARAVSRRGSASTLAIFRYCASYVSTLWLLLRLV